VVEGARNGERFQADGSSPTGGTPEQLLARIKQEIPLWREVARERACSPNELGTRWDANVERRVRRRNLPARPSPSVVARHARRTAETAAAFILAFLKPGMRLLDVGCGPVPLLPVCAARCAGETIGIDPSADVIATAKSLAGATAPRNLSFEVGSIYEPALWPRNVRRRLCESGAAASAPPGRRAAADAGAAAPGGVLGVRVLDWGSTIFYPESEGMRRASPSNST